jgi:signal transduction histidine kinase
MSPLSSLTNRIFLASALLVVLTIGTAIYRVNRSVSQQAEIDLRGRLNEDVSLVDEYSRTQFADFVRNGSLIADLPKLKATIASENVANSPTIAPAGSADQRAIAATVEPIASEYQRSIGADLFVVLGQTDRVLANVGRIKLDDATIAAIVADCRASKDGTVFRVVPGGALRTVAIPIEPPTPLGTLVVGFSLDRPFAERIKSVTTSDIAIVAHGQIVASTLDASRTAALAGAVQQSGIFQRRLDGEDFIGRVEPLGSGEGPDEPVALVLRSQTDQQRFLQQLRWQIAITGLAAVFLATIIGYAIARTVTGPVRALTATMREMAATGDLARATPVIGPWGDEDARLLASTFGQLTSALDRFQREAAQRDRLSSLGRLSTVVAHEIRNPLMIIKSAARTLRKSSATDVDEAARSIDEEVGRLNRVVSDVLDFAKPIRFELAPADLVQVCRDAIQAAESAGVGPGVRLDAADPSAPIVTDAERLRAALVNVVTNAQQAMRDQSATPSGAEPPIRVRLTRRDTGWRVDVIDRGKGVAPEDLPRLFDPFFTTRRAGSGIGLAITRNIIEGLGGTIVVTSPPQAGTTVRIELPDRTGISGGRA